MDFRRTRAFLFSALAVCGLAAAAPSARAQSPYAGNYKSGNAYVHTLVSGYPRTARQKAPIRSAVVNEDGTFDIFIAGMSIQDQAQRTTINMAIHGRVKPDGEMIIQQPKNVAVGTGQITGTSLKLTCTYLRNSRVVNYYDLRLKLKT